MLRAFTAIFLIFGTAMFQTIIFVLYGSSTMENRIRHNYEVARSIQLRDQLLVIRAQFIHDPIAYLFHEFQYYHDHPFIQLDGIWALYRDFFYLDGVFICAVLILGYIGIAAWRQLRTKNFTIPSVAEKPFISGITRNTGIPLLQAATLSASLSSGIRSDGEVEISRGYGTASDPGRNDFGTTSDPGRSNFGTASDDSDHDYGDN